MKHKLYGGEHFMENWLDVRYRELFVMFKGYHHKNGVINSYIMDKNGIKLSNETLNYEYARGISELMRYLRPYINYKYTEDEKEKLRNCIISLKDGGDDFKRAIGTLAEECPINMYGFPMGLYNCTVFDIQRYPEFDELLNPYGIYVASKWPNGYGGIGSVKLPSFTQGMDYLKNTFPQFDYKIFIDKNNILNG